MPGNLARRAREPTLDGRGVDRVGGSLTNLLTHGDLIVAKQNICMLTKSVYTLALAREYGGRVASRDEPSSVEAQHRSDLSPQPAKAGAEARNNRSLNAVNTKRETKKAFAAKAANAKRAVVLKAARLSENATAAEVVQLRRAA